MPLGVFAVAMFVSPFSAAVRVGLPAAPRRFDLRSLRGAQRRQARPSRLTSQHVHSIEQRVYRKSGRGQSAGFSDTTGLVVRDPSRSHGTWWAPTECGALDDRI